VSSEAVVNVTDADFEEQVLRSQQPVLVDLWAEWCAPCRMMAPVLEALAADYAGRLKVVKLDVDANGATAERYGIRSIPTFLLFKDGKVVEQLVGAVPKAKLAQAVDAAVGRAA
jgi:thioredoxin 1